MTYFAKARLVGVVWGKSNVVPDAFNDEGKTVTEKLQVESQCNLGGGSALGIPRVH